MSMRTVDGTQALISLEKEIDAATVATAIATYDATHVMTPGANDRWSADASSPTRQIINGAEIIRAATGMRPNLCVLGPKVYAAARIHSDVLMQIRYKGDGKQIGTKEDLAMLWDVERVVVGEAISVDEDDAVSDVWGNHVVLAYTKTGPVSRYEPSFAYGYQLAGTPLVEDPYFERRPHSWFYPRVRRVFAGGRRQGRGVPHPERHRLMSALVQCQARHVVILDGVTHQPFAIFELARTEAEELEALDALDILFDFVRPVSLVNGIGPKTEAKLAGLGIETLEGLAELEEGAIADLADRIDVAVAALAAWRLEAQGLVAAGRSGG